MSVYIAKPVGYGAVRSQAFSARSIPSFTMAKLSEVPQLAKAATTELAFSGYKDSIEAFLYATAINGRVNTQAGFFPLPDFEPSIPLKLPPIIFRLPKKATVEQHNAILQKLASSNIKALPEGNGPPAYVMSDPSWRDYSAAAKLGIPQTSSPGECLQVIAIPSLRTIYKCIELFLRVNTYYYRRSEAIARIATENLDQAANIDSLVSLATTNSWYITDKKRKAAPLTEEVFKAAIENGEWEDTFKNRTMIMHGRDAVLVAKPSPKPFKASLGSPNEVPNEPGLLFPFFQGMLTCDTAGLRHLVGKLFFRNFGVPGDSDARRGFQEFRNSAGIIAATPMGPVIGHILKAFEFALDAQAHAFLIFDGPEYLGFALLGDHYYIHNGTAWVEPRDATTLREDLATLSTHENILEALIGVLSETNDLDGDKIYVEVSEIDSASGLLTILATVDETQGDQVKELGKLIQGLHYEGGFLEIGPKSIEWALSMLSDSVDESLEGRNLFIPLSDWAECSSREFQVFAAFGPRAFHFINRKGTRIPIPKKEGDLDIFESVSGEPPKPTYPEILVYPCTISEALKKWHQLKREAVLTMDFDERAKGSRAMRWSGENKDIIWKKLKEMGKNGYFKAPEEDVTERSVMKGKKRALPEEFDLDAFIDDL